MVGQKRSFPNKMSRHAADVFGVRKRLFADEESACANLGVLEDWIPWSGLHFCDSIALTYFWFVPGSKHNHTSYMKTDIQDAFDTLCTSLGVDVCTLPETYSGIQDVYDVVMPCWKLVHSPDSPQREAYLALLMKDFSRACKVKTVDPAKVASFLGQSCQSFLEETIRAVQNEALSKFCQESTEKWMSYKYWLQNMNLFDRENEEVLTILFKAHLDSKMSKADLIARCEVSPGESVRVRFSGGYESCACTTETHP
jgi:hypothetical protein